jgi:pyrroloquinoline quinone biosynthesis protein B
VGYRLIDAKTGGQLLFMPDVADLDARAMDELQACDAVLLDGTFWSESEMQQMEVGTTGRRGRRALARAAASDSAGGRSPGGGAPTHSLSAAGMGHLPVGGPNGSLARIAALPIARRIYVHINNTNPMLIEGSPEHAAVVSAGIEIGWDGLEFEL